MFCVTGLGVLDVTGEIVNETGLDAGVMEDAEMLGLVTMEEVEADGEAEGHGGTYTITDMGVELAVGGLYGSTLIGVEVEVGAYTTVPY